MQEKLLRKVLVGIEETYTRQKIIDCFSHRTDYDVHEITPGTAHSSSEYDFYWLEYEDIDFEKLVKCKKRVLFNSFCIRKGLIRKAQMAYYLRKYIAKKPDCLLAKYLPETYVFELDYLDYLDEALNDCFEVEQALTQNDQIKKSKSTGVG